MFTEIVISLAVAFTGWVCARLWLHRQHLLLCRYVLRPRLRIRVSVAALLRVQDDDGYILFHSPLRPGHFGPPGGAIKYTPPGRTALERLGFQAEPRTLPDQRDDLRGFIPASSLPRFARWLRSGDGRESATECLKRELREELSEVGHPELEDSLGDLVFLPVRTPIEGPRRVAGQPYHQIRFFDIYDLDCTTPAAQALRQTLLDIAGDPSDTGVIRVRREDIEWGRHRVGFILSHAAFLFGSRKPPIGPRPPQPDHAQ
jgi:hypothetical protein